MGGEKIKLRILVPLTIAIVGLLGSFVSGTYRLMNGALHSQVDQYLASVKKVIRANHHSDIEVLGEIADNLARHQRLRQAYRNNNRPQAQSVLRPIFQELSQQHGISKLYIHDRDGVNFARAHQPHLFGDTMNHATLAGAIQTGDVCFGMELCDRGSFTFSFVLPWRYPGEIAGYIELGKDFQYITREVPAAFGVEMITLINKTHVSRKAWERAYRHGNIDVWWNTFSDFVIIDNTFDTIPARLNHWFSENPEEPPYNQRISLEGVTYSLAFFPLVDILGRKVGGVAVFCDITHYLEKTFKQLVLISAMCLIIGIALCVSFYKMLEGLEAELTDSRQKILRESQLRLEIERRHTKELAAHILELELARTRALKMVRESELAKQQAEKIKKEYLQKQGYPDR
ncbi:MAG: hypothetical protein JSV52_11565 [Candidatus Zixiibacteriota bacterium]|nr:MAG: hypothetical protein JSV52_11565 [candidate division Zixibacteria bacterium]